MTDRRFSSAGKEKKGFSKRVAAHAVHLGAVLVTENARELEGVPGLKIVRWTRP